MIGTLAFGVAVFTAAVALLGVIYLACVQADISDRIDALWSDYLDDDLTGREGLCTDPDCEYCNPDDTGTPV